ncbi:MAG: sodium/substrate symporter small subunit [Burkholderiaceae bacterium]
MRDHPSSSIEARRRRYWRRARRLTLALALGWFALTFGIVFFARELAQLRLFGWNLPFLLAAQGASLLYLALVGGHALAMRRLERTLDGEGDGGGSGDAE